MGADARVSLCTLGAAESGVDLCTLGNRVMVSGIGSARFNCSARVSNALRTGSPAVSEGVVGEGGCVKILIIFPAACFR
jgi:hypothetical protein